jgi:2-hydroxychromene-2-carboxylate isomerase
MSTSKQTVAWYFDFISPFAYLQWQLLQRQTIDFTLQPIPTLFAGLLAHWDNKGPVEILPKRQWTYEHCLWIAHRHSIPMRLPTQHPFNPLPLLRLCIAKQNDHAVVDRLFRYVWQEGHLPIDDHAWQALLKELQITHAEIETTQVKDTLRRHGEQAIAASVFGVPTAVVNQQCFWGVDATDMLIAYLQHDAFFSSAAFQGAQNLPVGIQRK